MGFSAKIILIIITVALATGGFTLGYFVGKNVSVPPDYAADTTRQSAPDAAVSKKEAEQQETAVNAQPDTKSAPLQNSPADMPAVPRQEPNSTGQDSAVQPSGKEKFLTPPAEPAKEPAPDKNQKNTILSNSYTVQVGAFRSQKEADTLSRTLENKGYKITIKKGTLKKGGHLFKVTTGEFSKKKEAEVLALKLRKTEGLNAFIAIKE